MSQLARQMRMVDSRVDPEDTWNNLSDSTVMQKYQASAAFANEALRLVLTNCTVGANVSELCKLGDDYILEQAAKVFSKGSVERGLAFPTCISINNVVSNYSPLKDESAAVLEAGDVVKVELGVQIDGYVSTLAHTIVLNPTPLEPVTGRKADVIAAAYMAAEAAIRLVKAGNESSQIFQTVNQIASSFGVRPVEGTASHLMKRFLLEAEQAIPNSTDPSTTDFTFGENEVISINIVFSTGAGQAYESTTHPTTVYQRDVSAAQGFKLKASRNTFNTVTKNFGVFPFSSRGLFDLDPAHKLGLPEVVKSGVLCGRPVIVEQDGEFVAQFKATVMVLPGNTGSMRLSAPLNCPYVHSVGAVQDNISTLLKQDVRVAKAKNPTVTSGMDLS
ncbi:peptidase M24, structural domain-containing protein [Obelidium mucronatum]|nr:peptidase M24, structural domain-containing protein [Obelidium mucronatum]